jgi:hypothetical protein
MTSVRRTVRRESDFWAKFIWTLTLRQGDPFHFSLCSHLLMEARLHEEHSQKRTWARERRWGPRQREARLSNATGRDGAFRSEPPSLP